MKRFRNILVGVDLADGDRLVAKSLGAPSAQAVEHALWVASLNKAHVTFLYALDVCPQAKQLLLDSQEEHTIVDEARDVLAGCVRKAEQLGVSSSVEVALGHAWLALVQRVLKCRHDLVVVGTRNRDIVSRMLFGSTGMKLLRKCPCPVWVTKPSGDAHIHTVLVAHDLSPVGALALELGASIAELHGSSLHILHAIEQKQYEDSTFHYLLEGPLEDKLAETRSLLGRPLQGYRFRAAPEVVVIEGDPVDTISKYIVDHGIELLTMGTIARTGISGVFMGNTAERLLPLVPCSILAVKPASFVSPVAAPK